MVESGSWGRGTASFRGCSEQGRAAAALRRRERGSIASSPPALARSPLSCTHTHKQQSERTHSLSPPSEADAASHCPQRKKKWPLPTTKTRRAASTSQSPRAAAPQRCARPLTRARAPTSSPRAASPPTARAASPSIALSPTSATTAASRPLCRPAHRLRRGDLVGLLLEAGADAAALYPYGRHDPLALCMACGQAESLRALLRQGHDAKPRGRIHRPVGHGGGREGSYRFQPAGYPSTSASPHYRSQPPDLRHGLTACA